MGKYTRAVLFYNSKSGQSDPDSHIRKIIDHFNSKEILIKIIDMPDTLESLRTIVSDAIDEGTDLFIAAGGDGTVSLVSNPLIGSDIPLGILPIGTGNFLAKEMRIPRHIKEALNIITATDSRLVKLDTIKLDDHHYIRNVSAGVSPKIIATTQSEEKKRLGFFAYMIHFFEQLLGLKLDNFIVEYDHTRETYNASEVIITNGRMLGVEPFERSEDSTFIDGVMDILIIRAANLIDVFHLIFSIFSKHNYKNPVIKSMHFKHYCRIETQTPLIVQADGDIVGTTPFEVHIEPQTLSIIVPKQIDFQASSENYLNKRS